MFVDFLGDAFSVSNPTLVPDNDPLDNCSTSSHGIWPLLSFFSIFLFLLTYMAQEPMLLESLLQMPLVWIKQRTFLICPSLVSLLKSHLEHVSLLIFSYQKLIFVYKIECLDALALVRQVRTTSNLFLQFLFSVLQFHNPCVDAITQAIYRAYDDKADISECLDVFFIKQSFGKKEKSLKNYL